MNKDLKNAYRPYDGYYDEKKPSVEEQLKDLERTIWKTNMTIRRLERQQREQQIKDHELHEIGYDLTLIRPRSTNLFMRKLSDLNIYLSHRDDQRCCYIWKRYDDDLFEMRTGALPHCDGLLFNIGQGTRGKGYMSYIGITGKREIVEKVSSIIDKHAEFIKDKEIGSNGYI